MTLNVSLSRAQLSEKLVQDTGLADRWAEGQNIVPSNHQFLPSLSPFCAGITPSPRSQGPLCQLRGPNILMCSVPASRTSPSPPECHRQSFSKTCSPCNFQFVRYIKIEGYLLQAAHIESDATFCVMSDHSKRNRWLPWAALSGFRAGRWWGQMKRYPGVWERWWLDAGHQAQF